MTSTRQWISLSKIKPTAWKKIKRNACKPEKVMRSSLSRGRKLWVMDDNKTTEPDMRGKTLTVRLSPVLCVGFKSMWACTLCIVFKCSLQDLQRSLFTFICASPSTGWVANQTSLCMSLIYRVQWSFSAIFTCFSLFPVPPPSEDQSVDSVEPPTSSSSPRGTTAARGFVVVWSVGPERAGGRGRLESSGSRVQLLFLLDKGVRDH